MYYEILIYWVLLAHFYLTLPLFFFPVCTFFLFYLFIFFKLKLFHQYLFESLRKQQLRNILLNIYVFNLIKFTKLCSLLVTFVNTQKTFQCCLNVAVRVICHRDVGQCQINVETTLYMWMLKFTPLNNIKSTLFISTLILTTLDKVETMLLLSMSSFLTLINVEAKLWIWSFFKKWKEEKNILELAEKNDSFD